MTHGNDGDIGDDEVMSVQGNEIEAVGGGVVETPEKKQLHADLLKEGLHDTGPSTGIGESGIDITEDNGPYM
jgi:hypothetical protein